tara:strand:+ start:168 stop:854 length:687 start_codon:yes stop_codon:yes gene_type:complete
MIDYFTFSTKDANQYGVDGAILLHHLRYWVAKNEANDKNFHEGKYWTYNSTSAFSKLFPFYTARKIGRLLTMLEDEGAIQSGNYNAKRYDRTKWFTLSNAFTESGTIHLPNLSNAYTKNVEPIPYNNQSITQSTTKRGLVFPFESKKFLKFWGIWKQYKKDEYKYTYNSLVSEQAALKNLAKISKNNEQNAIELIEHAIAQGWKGLYSTKKGDNKFDADEYRSYNESL